MPMTSHSKNTFLLVFSLLLYNHKEGQKCWDLSSDISKTSETSPPTPNKVEFCTTWVATTLLGGNGATTG